MYKYFENHIDISQSLFFRITFHVVSLVLCSEVKYKSELGIYPVKLICDINTLKQKTIQSANKVILVTL